MVPSSGASGSQLQLRQTPQQLRARYARRVAWRAALGLVVLAAIVWLAAQAHDLRLFLVSVGAMVGLGAVIRAIWVLWWWPKQLVSARHLTDVVATREGVYVTRHLSGQLAPAESRTVRINQAEGGAWLVAVQMRWQLADGSLAAPGREYCEVRVQGGTGAPVAMRRPRDGLWWGGWWDVAPVSNGPQVLLANKSLVGQAYTLLAWGPAAPEGAPDHLLETAQGPIRRPRG